MPHDKHGKEVKVGDLVTITAKVTERHESEHYCNLTLETVEIMPRSDEGLGPGQRTMLTLNAKQVELKEARNRTQASK